MLRAKRNERVGVTAYNVACKWQQLHRGFCYEGIERVDDISMLPSGILSGTFNGAFKFFKHNEVLVRLQVKRSDGIPSPLKI